MIKAVIFDYGGVVKVGHPLSMDLARICNISEGELAQTKEERKLLSDQAEKGFMLDEQFFLEFQKIFAKPLPNNCLEQAQDVYRKTFKFIPETLELVKELKKQGIKTAVLSNIFKFEAEVIREHNGYDGFDPVILSYEVGMVKPELDIYRLVIGELKVKPEECVFIDDKERNLLPAKELGIKTVLAQNPAQIAKDVFLYVDRSL